MDRISSAVFREAHNRQIEALSDGPEHFYKKGHLDY